jgi:3-deoxy-manno-octulosonate cytidylyltransferase (CMP-KDO synthetase)
MLARRRWQITPVLRSRRRTNSTIRLGHHFPGNLVRDLQVASGTLTLYGIMKVIAVIPARLASTRLPRKMLRLLAGEPLLAHVYRGVRKSHLLGEVIVATDSSEIMEFCRAQGWPAQMTANSHRSGTERVHEVAQSIAADVYINVQGDEPLTRAAHIEALVELMKEPSKQVGTLKTAAAEVDISNPGAVKVVTDSTGRALYFSRATIPFDRDGAGTARYWKHLGFYAYRKAALDRFVSWPESSLERCERLEQLRFLENGIPIHVAETAYDTIGVDTEEDLRRAEQRLCAGKGTLMDTD